MSAAATRFLAKYDCPAPAALKKSVGADTGKLTFKSLLTYPVKDLAGDYVVPEGCDFTPHHADPYIDLEHGRDPFVKGMPAAWARESLSEPGAPYAVDMVRLNFAADGAAPEYHTVPVGTEFYDKSCKFSMQVFHLREQGLLSASSLEFAIVPGFYKAIGHSELENRPAYHFDRVAVQRWTVCAQGVNPGALLLTKSLPQVAGRLCQIIHDRRVNVGGLYEPLHERIYKALAPAVAPRKPSTVRVETKAMDETDPALQTADEQAVGDTGAQPDEAPALGGVSAKYKFAAAIKAACDEYEADMRSSDSPELRKLSEKFVAQAVTLAEKVKGAADKHDAKLTGGDYAEPDAPEGEEAPEPSSPVEEDEDGLMKGVRPAYLPVLKALRAKRFSVADVQKAQEAKTEPAPETPEQALARIRREEPEKYAEFQRELRLINACA